MDKEKISAFASEAGIKAKEIAAIAKYQALIQKENAQIKREYYRLGKKYFQLFAETPDLDLIKYTDTINELNEKIFIYKTKIAQIKQEKQEKASAEQAQDEDGGEDDN